MERCKCNIPHPRDDASGVPVCLNCDRVIGSGTYPLARGFALVVEANGEWWYDEPEPRPQIRKMRDYDD